MLSYHAPLNRRLKVIEREVKRHLRTVADYISRRFALWQTRITNSQSLTVR